LAADEGLNEERSNELRLDEEPFEEHEQVKNEDAEPALGVNDPPDDEETAGELAPPVPGNRDAGLTNPEADRPDVNAESEVDEQGGTWMSVTGIVASILAMFMLPYVLGIVGIIMGYLGFRAGARTSGAWAIGLGVLAILGTLILRPFLY